MAKKGNLPMLYLIGMAVVVIGFCVPMFKSFLGTTNGFKFIDFDHFGFVTIGALLIFLGAVLGVLSCFLPQLSGLKMAALGVSVLGGVILVIGCFSDSFYKAIGKGFVKHAYVGFYMVIAGWVVAALGVLKK